MLPGTQSPWWTTNNFCFRPGGRTVNILCFRPEGDERCQGRNPWWAMNNFCFPARRAHERCQGRSPWWAMNTFSFRPQGERMLPGTKSLVDNEQLLFPPGGRTNVARTQSLENNHS